MSNDSPEYPDLPDGWQWASGSRGGSHYTRWFQTEYRRGGDLVGLDGSIGGFDGEVYWDEGNDHTVQIYPITGERDDGDPEVSEYATITRKFDTEQAALDAVPELIRELKADAQE